jgi:hypothetical protein
VVGEGQNGEGYKLHRLCLVRIRMVAAIVHGQTREGCGVRRQGGVS